MDLRKLSTDTAPLYINSKCGEVPHLQISWCPHLCQPLLDTAAHSSHHKKAQEHLHFLRVLRTLSNSKLLLTFYCSSVASLHHSLLFQTG